MISNTSFASSNIDKQTTANREIKTKKNLERLKPLKHENTEIEIKRLENRPISQLKFYPSSPIESLGRSQVTIKGKPSPIILSDEDLSLLEKLNAKKYGFHPNGRDFWVHSKQQKEDGSFGYCLGDGKIQDNTSPKDFIKKLIDDDVQAINITGRNNYGEDVALAFILDKDTNSVKIYSEKSPKGEDCIEYSGIDGFRSAIYDSVKNFKRIYGTTIWS